LRLTCEVAFTLFTVVAFWPPEAADAVSATAALIAVAPSAAANAASLIFKFMTILLVVCHTSKRSQRFGRGEKAFGSNNQIPMMLQRLRLNSFVVA
jgi:hypothetical protein